MVCSVSGGSRMWRELIAAGRRLRSDRWATASAAVAIALGTGLASAVFAIAYGVLLRPLPYRDASRLVMLDASAPLGQIDEWRQRLPALAPLAACARSPLTVRGMGDPRPVPAAVVDDAFFEVLGVPPVEGRVFGALHETGVAVVSERFARDAGAPAGAILGHTIRIGSAPLTVVGVMGDRFAFPSDATDVWIPARAVPAVPLGASADERRFQLFGHLRAGATLAEVRAEAARALTAIDPRARPFPGGGADLLRDRITAPVRPALFACGAAAALVLLVACANVATILIGRTIARVRELAIRRAIGASRGQIFATTVAEAVLIACAGGAAGAALAALAVRATVRPACRG